MPAVSFGNLLVVAAIAVGAPLLVGLVPRIRVPAVVLEIVAGIAVGPSGLGRVELDLPVQILALAGLAFLLFLAGLETILGAFLAGALLNLVDRDTATHPHFRVKVEAVGYGFVIPVFFVSSGLRFDLEALLDSPSAFARAPLFLLALLLVRGVPALLYLPVVGTRRAIACGLLQATSLPLLVTASDIGVAIGAIQPVTAAALISAGLLSVLIFPLLALGLLGGEEAEDDGVGETAATARPSTA